MPTFCRRYCPEFRHALGLLSLLLTLANETHLRRLIRSAKILQGNGALRLPTPSVWLVPPLPSPPALPGLSRRGWRCRPYMLTPHRQSLTWCAYLFSQIGRFVECFFHEVSGLAEATAAPGFERFLNEGAGVGAVHWGRVAEAGFCRLARHGFLWRGPGWSWSGAVSSS